MSTKGDYQTAIQYMYSTVIYKDDKGDTDDKAEVEKKVLLLQILGWAPYDFKTSSLSGNLKTYYPDLVDIFPPIYPVRSGNKCKTSSSFCFSMQNFYQNWSNVILVGNFLKIFKVFITSKLPATPYKYSNQVANYFLSIFFGNYAYDVITNVGLNWTPSLVPSSSQFYVPLISKMALFFNYETDLTQGVGRIGGDYINNVCMKNFNSYLNKNSKNKISLKTLPLYENVDYDWTPFLEVKENSRLVDAYRNSVGFGVNDTLNIWCGCFMPPNQVLNKELGGKAKSTDNVSSYNICDPVCVQPKSIKRFSGLGEVGEDTNMPLQCSANICAISNITLSSYDSSAPILFENICTGCVNDKTNTCFCVLDMTNMEAYFNKIEYQGQSLMDQGIFQQLCPNSACYEVDNDVLKYYPCDTKLTAYTGGLTNFRGSGLTIKKYYEETGTDFYIIFFIFIGIIFLLLFYGLFEVFEKIKRKIRNKRDK